MIVKIGRARILAQSLGCRGCGTEHEREWFEDSRIECAIGNEKFTLPVWICGRYKAKAKTETNQERTIECSEITKKSKTRILARARS